MRTARRPQGLVVLCVVFAVVFAMGCDGLLFGGHDRLGVCSASPHAFAVGQYTEDQYVGVSRTSGNTAVVARVRNLACGGCCGYTSSGGYSVNPTLTGVSGLNSYACEDGYTYGTDGVNVVALPDGWFMLSFRDKLNKMHVRRLTPSAATSGAKVLLLAAYQTFASMAYLSTGHVVVVSGYGTYPLMFQVVTVVPVLVHSNVSPSATTVPANKRPGVGALPDGSFVILWGAVSGDGSGQAIYGRRFARVDAGCVPLSGDTLLNGDVPGGDQIDPTGVGLTVDGTDVFFAVWESQSGDAGGLACIGRVFTPDLVPLTPSFPITSDQLGNQISCRIRHFAGNVVAVGAHHSSTGRVTTRLLALSLSPDAPLAVVPLTRDVNLAGGYSVTTALSAPGFDTVPYAPGLPRRIVSSFAAYRLPYGYTTMLTGHCVSPELSVDAVVVDAALCGTHSQLPLSMACLAAAVAAAPTDATLVLAAGEWTGCPIGGILLDRAVSIVGAAGGGGTRINCAGAPQGARAFVVDGSLMADATQATRSVSISGLALSGGSGDDGGLIRVADTLQGPLVFLEDLALSASNASGAGGCVALDNAVGVLLTNVSFTACSAGSDGGGLAVTLSPPPNAFPPEVVAQSAFVVSLTRCSFVACTAAGAGGGAFVQLDPVTPLTAVFKNLEFDGCEAASGGGLHLSSHSVAPVSLGPAVAFTSCSASGSGGGAVLFDLATSPTLDTVSFTACTAGATGGALYLARDVEAVVAPRLTNTTISACSATLGGGGVASFEVGLDVDVASVVTACSTPADGGGLLLVSSEVVGGPEFAVAGAVSMCSAGGSGGGAYVGGGALTTSLTASFTANTAALFGGGVATAMGTLTTMYEPGFPAHPYTATSFAGNMAGIDGSAIHACIASLACGRTACDASTAATLPVAAVAVNDTGTRYELSAGVVALGSHPISAGGHVLASDPVVLVLPPAPPSAAVNSGEAPLAGTPVIYDVFGQVAVAGPTELILFHAAPSASSPLGGAAGARLSPTSCPVESCDLAGVSLSATLLADLGAAATITASLLTAPCIAATPVEVAVSECPPELTPVIDGGVYVCSIVCVGGEYVDLGAGAAGVCVACPPGTALGTDNHSLRSCTPCPRGTYARGGARVCTPCPPGGNCGDGTFVHALPGYWFAEGSDAEGTSVPAFIECTPPSACPGGANYTACATAYRPSAFLCSKCSADNARLGDECTACLPSTATLVFAAAIILLLVGALSFVVWVAAAGSAGGALTARSARMLVLKIAINWAQTIVLAAVFKAQTNAFLRSITMLVASVASPSPSLHTFECLFGEWTFRDDFVMHLALPVAVLAFCVLFWAGAVATGTARAVGRTVQVGIVLLTVVHPLVSSKVLRVFHCKSFAGIEGRRLVADLDIVCYEGEHVWMVSMATLGVLVYVLGIPLAALGLMVVARARASMAVFQARFAFLASGYADSLWWFEFVIVARKVAATAILVFVNASSLQLSLGSTLLGLALAVHLGLAPFLAQWLNFVEMVSLVGVISLLLSATTTIASSDAASLEQDVLVFLALAINAVFLVMLIGSFVATSLWMSPRKALSSDRSARASRSDTNDVALATLDPFSSSSELLTESASE